MLHHFALGFLSRTEYSNEFVYNYGQWTRSLAEKLWEERGRSAADPAYFQYPLLKRLAERAALVVHNPAAARMVRRHHSSTHVVEIPHLAIPHPSSAPGRKRTFPSEAWHWIEFGVFGHLRESKV